MTDIEPTAPRSALTIPEGVAWAMLEELPWREGACKGMKADYHAARHIYIAMRPPRSIKRCKDEMDWLGFVDHELRNPDVDKARTISVGTLRSWSIKGDWSRDARLHDMGMCTIEELRLRVIGLREAAMLPLIDSLAEVIMAATDAEKIELAATRAAEAGNISGMMDAAKKAADLIGYITGTAEQADGKPAPQVHQHLHAHVDGAGDAVPPQAAGPLSRVLTPFTRTLDRLDAAAAEKRAQGTAKKANGHAKTINGNGHAEESDDER